MSFGYQVLGFGAGSPAAAAYDPGMMTYDGSTGYYSKQNITVAANAFTVLARVNLAPTTGADLNRLISIQLDTGDTWRCLFVIYDSDHGNSELHNKAALFVSDAGGNILWVLSDVVVADSTDHTIFVAYDATAGTVIFYCDGVSCDDAGFSSRVLTTGTLITGTADMGVGGGDAGVSKILGDMGYVGYREAYLTNPTDFYHPSNGLQQLDESGWTEWGAQPAFWNEFGTMTDNKGSGGNMTKNGTITGPS